MSTELTVHPIALCVPEMGEHEYAELKRSMAANGYDDHFPVVLYEGQILDGRHRYRAAMELGITPAMTTFTPHGEDTPARFVLRSLTRRSLTAGQRAAIATELLPTLEKEAEQRQKAGVNLSEKVRTGQEGRSSKVAAKAVGTNEKYVETAKKVKEADPDTFEKMKAGEITIAQARTAISRPPVPPDPDDAAEPEPFVDHEGKPVTDPDVRAAIEAGDQFMDLHREVHALKRKILALADTPIGHVLHDRRGDIEQAMKGVAGFLDDCRPWTTCPLQPNCTAGSKCCYGTKWVPKAIYKHLPPDVKGGGA